MHFDIFHEIVRKRGTYHEKAAKNTENYLRNNRKTYKHSVKGSKSSGRHQTKVSSCIKSENLIFCIFWNMEWFYNNDIFDFPIDHLLETPFQNYEN